MVKKTRKKGRIKQKLTDKYRLVVLNEDTFEERFSLKLSRLNVFVFGSLFSILLVALTVLLIAFSSLKEYIPGYAPTALKNKIAKLAYTTDSLQTSLRLLTNYTNALKPVFTGSITGANLIDSIKNQVPIAPFSEDLLDATKEDSLFREKIESEDRFPLIDEATRSTKIVFFAPVTGSITQQFNAEHKHFAIDIVAKTGTPVQAVADGTVILSEWTAATGYVLTIQHVKDFISVYKHNGTLLKKQGEFVRSGEVIASVGATGELTTGPHLHFELWNNGYPVNPMNYIDFQ